jgi:hypothetical protein
MRLSSQESAARPLHFNICTVLNQLSITSALRIPRSILGIMLHAELFA